MRVDYTYDPDSDRLSRLFVDKVGQLALLDLRYSYDLAGNVTQIDDGARGEVRGYVYDHLDRLTFAAVREGTQLIEERYYTYDTIGNLLSFRHRRPSADRGRGAFTPGAEKVDGTTYWTRADFNPLAETGLSSETYEAAGVMPYVRGVDGTGSSSDGATRGAFYSGEVGEGTTYHGAAGTNPIVVRRAPSGDIPPDPPQDPPSSENYELWTVSAFTRGMVGGFGGYESSYSGPTGETTLTYTYAENGAGPHAVTSLSDGQSFVYDANGNMIERWQDTTKEWSHTFDAENRLVEVVDHTTTPDTTTTYVYDGDGARVKRIVDDGTTETTTIYVAGMEIKLVDDVEEQRTVYYAMGGAFRIIGGDDEGLYFRHGDHLGSTTVLSDEDGVKVTDSEVVYAPFGEIREGDQSALTDFGFTGQRLDSSTGGLMYYGARYYLPELRRFISADTIVPGGANSQAYNRYSYVLNSPLNYIDPTGHDQWYMPGGYKDRGFGGRVLPSPKKEKKGEHGNPGSISSGHSGGSGNKNKKDKERKGGRYGGSYKTKEPISGEHGTPGSISNGSTSPVYQGGHSEAYLAAFQQRQIGNNCAPYAVAAGISMLNGSKIDYAEAVNIANTTAQTPRGYTYYPYRVARDFAVTPAQQAALAEAVGDQYGLDLSTVVMRATTDDLVRSLSDPDSVVLVTVGAIGFKDDRVTLSYKGDPKRVPPFAGVGAHTMVLVAHDPQKDGGPWGFANSWTDGGSDLYWMTDDELARTGKSSILNNVVVITKNP